MACFRDEEVIYGEAGGGAVTTLNGARIYGLREGTYDFLFTEPEATATARVTATGTSRTALREVACQ